MPRKEFLYELRFWEIQSIIRGYRLRARPTWESARMTAFWIMSSMADLSKSGIHSDRDLIKFPWEKDATNMPLPSDAEIERLREIMRAENAAREKIGDTDS